MRAPVATYGPQTAQSRLLTCELGPFMMSARRLPSASSLGWARGNYSSSGQLPPQLVLCRVQVPVSRPLTCCAGSGNCTRQAAKRPAQSVSAGRSLSALTARTIPRGRHSGPPEGMRQRPGASSAPRTRWARTRDCARCVWHSAVVTGAKRPDGGHWLTAVRHRTRRDGLIALGCFLLPGLVALALLRRHHHLDIGTVTVLVSVALSLPVLWLTWATYRDAGGSATLWGSIT